MGLRQFSAPSSIILIAFRLLSISFFPSKRYWSISFDVFAAFFIASTRLRASASVSVGDSPDHWGTWNGLEGEPMFLVLLLLLNIRCDVWTIRKGTSLVERLIGADCQTNTSRRARTGRRAGLVARSALPLGIYMPQRKMQGQAAGWHMSLMAGCDQAVIRLMGML